MSNLLSLIIPVYGNEGSIPDLIDGLIKLQNDLQSDLEVVFVVDGSPDSSYELLHNRLETLPFRTQLILLSRNFGSFAAVRAGLEGGRGNRFAVMAADLQEPPELVMQMDNALLTEDVDVVIGVRDGRQDPWTTRLPAHIFWTVYRRYVIADIPSGGVDVFACTKAFRDQLLKLEERHSSLVAQVFWMGYTRKFITYTRQMRKHGKSAWTFGKKFRYMMDSIFSFTDLPIRMLMWAGACTAFVSGFFGLLVVVSRVFGLVAVPGYAATILAIIFFGALNMFALGIVGSYAWRTYENTKARPLHIVLKSHVFDPAMRRDHESASKAA
jgi:glycosyltransferase involved in cell wall biosynthesis